MARNHLYIMMSLILCMFMPEVSANQHDGKGVAVGPRAQGKMTQQDHYRSRQAKKGAPKAGRHDQHQKRVQRQHQLKQMSEREQEQQRYRKAGALSWEAARERNETKRQRKEQLEQYNQVARDAYRQSRKETLEANPYWEHPYVQIVGKSHHKAPKIDPSKIELTAEFKSGDAKTKVVRPNYQADLEVDRYKHVLQMSEFQLNVGEVAFRGVTAYAIEVLQAELRNYSFQEGGIDARAPLSRRLKDPGFLEYLSQRYNPNHKGTLYNGRKVKSQSGFKITGRKIMDPEMERLWNDLMRLTGNFNKNTVTLGYQGYWESPTFRRHYHQFMAYTLLPRLQNVSDNNGKIGKGLIEVEVEERKDKKTGKETVEYKYYFNKDRKSPFVLEMDMMKMEQQARETSYQLIPDMELRKFELYDTFVRSGADTIKSLPAQTLGFAAATCAVAGVGLARKSLPEGGYGLGWLMPGFNDSPTDFQTGCTQFFSEDTVIDIGAWANFGVFIYAHKVADKAMASVNFMRRYQIWRSKIGFDAKTGAVYTKIHRPWQFTQFMAGQMRNFVGLGVGSFVSGVVSDLYLLFDDCRVGYYKERPTDAAEIEEWQIRKEGCDLAYARWSRGEVMDTHMGHIPALGAAAFVSALHRAVIDNQILKYLDKGKAQGKWVRTKLRNFFASMKHIKLPFLTSINVPFIYNLMLFLQYDKALAPYTAKPYTSARIAEKMDGVENKLYEDMQAFKANNWVIPGKKSIEGCDRPANQLFALVGWQDKMYNQYRRKYSGVLQPSQKDEKLVRYTGEGEDDEVCFDDTLFETVDDYGAAQRQWRDFKLEKPNMEYSSHLTGMLDVGDQYQSSKHIYEDFIEKVRNRSSVIFYDKNPLSGITGIGEKDDGTAVEIIDDGKYSVSAMQKFQKYKISLAGGVLNEAIEKIGKVDEKKEPNFFRVLKEFQQIRDIFLVTPEALAQHPQSLFRVVFEQEMKNYKIGAFDVYKKIRSEEVSEDQFEANWSAIEGLAAVKEQWPEQPKSMQEAMTYIGMWLLNTKVLGQGIDPHAYYLKWGVDRLMKQASHYEKWCGEAFAIEKNRIIETLEQAGVNLVDAEYPGFGKITEVPSDQAISEYLGKQATPETNSRLLPCAIAPQVAIELADRYAGENPHKAYVRLLNSKLLDEGVESKELKRSVGKIKPEQMAEHVFAKMACGTSKAVAKRGLLSRGLFVVKKWYHGDDLKDREDLFSEPVGWAKNFKIPAIVKDHEDRMDICTHYEQYDDSTPYSPRSNSWRKAEFSMFDWDKLAAIPANLENPKAQYKNLIFYLRENIREDFLQEGEFGFWWTNNVQSYFDEITFYMEANYRRVMQKGFLHALYGEIEYMNDENLNCNDQTYVPSWVHAPFWSEVPMKEGMSSGSTQSTVLRGDGSSTGLGEVEVPSTHQYPPKFYTRSQLRTCSAKRKDYMPVHNNIRLELEMYLSEVLKPIWLSQFEGDSPFKNKVRVAKDLFDQRAKEIFRRMDELVDYKLARDFGEGFCGTGDLSEIEAEYTPRSYKCEAKAKAQFSNLLAAVYAFKVDMGLMHPKEPVVKGLFEGFENAPAGFKPDEKDLVELDDVFRRPDGKNLSTYKGIPNWIQGKTQDGQRFLINPYTHLDIPYDMERPYQRLTKDQQAIVTITVAKMAALAQEVFNYQRMINDLNFNF